MKRLSRDILLMALATMISRVFGLFREISIADRFGLGTALDAFFIAIYLPNSLRLLFAEGALSTAFVPIYSGASLNNEDATRFANNVLSLLLIIFPALVITGVLLAPVYLPFFASGFPVEKLALAVHITQAIFPFIALIGFAAAFMGILHAQHRFFAAASAPILYNVGMILGALFLTRLFPVQPVYGLVVGALLGAGGQLLLQWSLVHRLGFRFRFTLFPLHPGIRQMARLMLPALLSLAVMQINLLVDNKLASHLDDGAVSALQYAMRLFQLPLGVFAVSVATALLPRFSAASAQKDGERFNAHLSEGLSQTAFLLLPAMAGLLAIGTGVIRLLFQHGQFTAADTLRTATVLCYYVGGIFPYGLVYLFTRAFYAMRRPLIPVLASCAAVGTNVVFDLLLVGSFKEGGLALSTSLAGLANAGLLTLFLWRQMSLDSRLLKRLGKILLGAGLIYAVAWAVQRPFPQSAPLGSVFLPILVGALFYLLYARFTGLWDLIRQRPADPPA